MLHFLTTQFNNWWKAEIHKFPLLKLPNLAMMNVIQQMDLAHVIELTMLCRRFKKILHVYKFRVHSLTWSYPTGIELFFEKNLQISFYSDWEDNQKSRKLNGNSVTVAPEYINDHVKGLKIKLEEFKTKSQLLKELTIHLLSILRVKHFKFELKSSVGEPLQNIFIWNYRKKFQSFKVSNEAPAMTPEELTFVLEGLQSNQIDLKLKIKNYQYLKPLNCLSVNLIRLEWLSQETLLNSNCREWILDGRPGHHSVNIREFVENWMSRANDELEIFIMTSSYGNFRADGNTGHTVLDIVGATPTVFTASDLKYRSGRFREDAIIMDIRRATDGRFATLSWSPNIVHFFVWHEKNIKWIGLKTKEKLMKLKKHLNDLNKPRPLWNSS